MNLKTNGWLHFSHFANTLIRIKEGRRGKNDRRTDKSSRPAECRPDCRRDRLILGLPYDVISALRFNFVFSIEAQLFKVWKRNK